MARVHPAVQALMLTDHLPPPKPKRCPAQTATGHGIVGLDPSHPRLHAVVIDLSGPDLWIVIADVNGRTQVRLGPFAEEDVIAIWRSLCAATGLTAMMRTGGELTALAPQIGRVRLGATHARRRVAPGGRRRPRFLLRRKTGRSPDQVSLERIGRIT